MGRGNLFVSCLLMHIAQPPPLTVLHHPLIAQHLLHTAPLHPLTVPLHLLTVLHLPLTVPRHQPIALPLQVIALPHQAIALPHRATVILHLATIPQLDTALHLHTHQLVPSCHLQVHTVLPLQVTGIFSPPVFCLLYRYPIPFGMIALF